MSGTGEHCREKQCFDTNQKFSQYPQGVEEMDHASNMTPSQLFYLSSCMPALLQECPSRQLSRIADPSFRHFLSSSTCLFSAQQGHLHISHPLSQPSNQSCRSKRSFETLLWRLQQPPSSHTACMPLSGPCTLPSDLSALSGAVVFHRSNFRGCCHVQWWSLLQVLTQVVMIFTLWFIS